MEAPMKYICFLVFVVVLSIVGLNGIDGAGECGMISSPNSEVEEMDPCTPAVLDENSIVTDECCQLVKRVVTNPSCFCAVMLSDSVKKAGIKLEIAATLPKRCNLVDRPIGYKCGDYTLP